MTYEELATPRFHQPATTEWAAQVGENLEWLWTDRPTVSLIKSTDTVVGAPGTTTTVEWTSTEWEVGDWWTSGEAVFAPREGIYFVTVNVDWQADTAGVRNVSVFQNYAGDPTSVWELPMMWSNASPDQTTGYCTQNVSALVYLAEGDALVTGYFRSGDDFEVDTYTANGGKQTFRAIWLGGYDQ